MSLLTHLDALQHRHQQLSAQIDDAYTHHEEDVHVTQLKKERLRLKEEIEALRHQTTEQPLEDAA